MLNNFFGDIKDKSSLYYRRAVRAEQIRERKSQQQRKDQNEFLRKMKWLIYTAIAGICLYFVNQWYFVSRLSQNGTVTFAIIENIRHEQYVANELGGGLVDHYYVSYKFKVKNNWIHSISELKSYQYTSHLGESPESGDTIRVKYLLENPNDNKLVRLK